MQTYSGKIIGVETSLSSRRVRIRDQSENEHFFTFRRLATAGVFLEMQKIGQPLIVAVEAGSPSFSAGFPARVIKATDKLDRTIEVDVDDSTPYRYVLSEKWESKYRDILLTIKEPTFFWLVPESESEQNDKLTIRLRTVYGFAESVLQRSEPFDLESSRATPPLTVLSVREVHELFRIMKSFSTDPLRRPNTGIPFLFPKSGCEYRCHFMAREINRLGINACKLWVKSAPNCELEFQTNQVKECYVKWIIHTAIGVALQNSNELIAIDPSTCTQAVRVSTWCNHFSTNSTRLPLPSSSLHVLAVDRSDGSPLHYDHDYKISERVISGIRNQLHLLHISKNPPPFVC